MTAVEFHTQVADPLAFACRLLRKIYRVGARAIVIGPAAQLQALDRALWTFDERDFVPHLRVSGSRPPGAAAARTPLWLVDGAVPAQAPEVMVNLGADVPHPLAPFTRVIEIVGADADQAARARARWREYRGLGLTVKHHPLAGTV